MRARWPKNALRVAGAVAIVLVLMFLLVVGLGRATWALSDATRTPPDPAAVPPDRHPAEARGTHSVAEWPAEKGRDFHQASALDADVAAGRLPPVAERLPADPLVIVPPESRGPYGGTWRRFATHTGDIGIYEARFAYEGLVRWDAAGRTILPNLATGWTIEDEGRSFTFRLRRGVRWSDGAPFSADDVMFWFQDVLSNKDLTPVVATAWRRAGEPVRVEKLDDYTVRFRFHAVHGLFLQYLASGEGMVCIGYPAHYLRRFHPRYQPIAKLESAARERGMDLWHQLFADRRDWRNPECPRLWAWVLKTPPPAQPVVFARNPYYWKVDPDGRQLPYIDRLTFEEYELETINLKAMNGEIGMQDRHMVFSNYPLFMANRRRGRYHVLHWINGVGSSGVLTPNLNHRDPVLRKLLEDRRFRIALSHAINRDEINELHFLGAGRPSQVAPPEGSLFHSPSYQRAHTEHDPALANRMLDEMGLSTRNAEGVRLRPDGRPLALFIEATNTYWVPSEVVQRVADGWTAVGVKTVLRLQARPLWQTRVDAMMHDVSVWTGADEIYPLMDPRWFFPSDAGALQALDYARWFRTEGAQGEPPPPDIRRCMELFRRIEQTVDPDEHVRLFRRIIDLNEENLWIIGLVSYVPQIVLVKDGFLNVPEAAVAGWVFRTPGNTAPECYAIRNDE